MGSRFSAFSAAGSSPTTSGRAAPPHSPARGTHVGLPNPNLVESHPPPLPLRLDSSLSPLPSIRAVEGSLLPVGHRLSLLRPSPGPPFPRVSPLCKPLPTTQYSRFPRGSLPQLGFLLARPPVKYSGHLPRHPPYPRGLCFFPASFPFPTNSRPLPPAFLTPSPLSAPPPNPACSWRLL